MTVGMGFPVQINPATGCFEEADGAESIRESVYLILMTQKGERTARPEFGSRIMGYTFLDFSPTRIHMLEREVRDTILSQEPRVEKVKVQIEWIQEEAQVLVCVDYSISGMMTEEHLELRV